MGTTAQKLTYTANAINGIKNALEERGIVVGDTPLGDYASLIESISTDGITGFAEKTITKVTEGMIEGITQIGDYAFYNQSDLTTIEIPDTVTSIGDYAFYNCTGLSSVILPDGVTSIGEYAFRGCTGLISVTIPNSVTSIGEYAFYKCSSLEYIYFNGYESEWNSISKGQEWDDLTGNYQVVCWSEGLSIVSKGDGTCYVDGIGTCTDTDLVIPSTSPDGDSVTGIGEQAFEVCTSLTSVIIPDSVTSVAYEAFCGCSSLEYVKVLAVSPPRTPNPKRWIAFDDTNNCPIYVPTESVSAYRSRSDWSDYASRIQAMPS